MEAKTNHPTRSPGLDAMSARSAGEVLDILRDTAGAEPGPSAERGNEGGRRPTGLWKTGWQTRCAGTAAEGGRRPTGLWKTGWDAQPESAA